MKKLLVVMLVVSCISPAWAQRPFRRFKPFRKPAVSTSLETSVQRKARTGSTSVQPTRLLNLKSHSDVATRLPAESTVPANLTHPENLSQPVLPPLQTSVSQGFLSDQVRRAAVRPDVPQGLEAPVSIRIAPSQTPVRNSGKTFSVLSDAKLRLAISNDPNMELFVPQFFTQTDQVLYRGLRLHNTEELKNILAEGMRIDKTHHNMIFVSPNVSVAMEYMFPRLAAQLFGNDSPVALPVLVKIPVTPRLLQENPPLKPEVDFGGRRIFEKDILADDIAEVAVYVKINNVHGWYTVTLENGELVFTPAPAATIRGWISE